MAAYETVAGTLAVQKVPGNDRCVDCGAPDPDWASINLGILMCLECSGIHRSLGTHISKVRSLKLDVECWHGALLNFMLSVGNNAFNEYWEATVPPETMRPGPDPAAEPNATQTGIRECFIRDKYQYRVFFRDFTAESVVSISPRRGSTTSSVDSLRQGFNGLASIYGPLEATMEKMSGRPHLSMSTWQMRTLRMDPESRTIKYFKTADAEEEKGAIVLEGATASLETDANLHGGRGVHLWRISTSDSKGRKAKGYVFNANSARESVRWVENVRRYAERRVRVASTAELNMGPMAHSPNATPLAKVQHVFRMEANDHVAEGIVLRGTLRLRVRPSWGNWMNHYVMVTPKSILVFPAADGPSDAAIIALPMQYVNVDASPLDAVDAGIEVRGELQESNPTHMACFWGPLGAIMLGFDDMDEKQEWVEGVKSAIRAAPTMDFSGVRDSHFPTSAGQAPEIGAVATLPSRHLTAEELKTMEAL